MALLWVKASVGGRRKKTVNSSRWFGPGSRDLNLGCGHGTEGRPITGQPLPAALSFVRRVFLQFSASVSLLLLLLLFTTSPAHVAISVWWSLMCSILAVGILSHCRGWNSQRETPVVNRPFFSGYEGSGFHIRVTCYFGRFGMLYGVILYGDTVQVDS